MESDGLPLYPSVYPHPTKIVQKDNMNQQIPTAMGSQQTQNPLVLLGPENTITTCPFCHASIKSAVKYTVNTRTHIAAAVCCLACFCCIPYCLDSAKNADHYCPNCQRYIGTYHK